MKRYHKWFLAAIISFGQTFFWIAMNCQFDQHDYNTKMLYCVACGFIGAGIGSTIFCLGNGISCAEKGL